MFIRKEKHPPFVLFVCVRLCLILGVVFHFLMKQGILLHVCLMFNMFGNPNKQRHTCILCIINFSESPFGKSRLVDMYTSIYARGLNLGVSVFWVVGYGLLESVAKFVCNIQRLRIGGTKRKKSSKKAGWSCGNWSTTHNQHSLGRNFAMGFQSQWNICLFSDVCCCNIHSH